MSLLVSGLPLKILKGSEKSSPRITSHQNILILWKLQSTSQKIRLFTQSLWLLVDSSILLNNCRSIQQISRAMFYTLKTLHKRQRNLSSRKACPYRVSFQAWFITSMIRLMIWTKEWSSELPVVSNSMKVIITRVKKFLMDKIVNSWILMPNFLLNVGVN